MLVEHIVVLQGACKGRDGRSGSLLLEKQLLSYLFSSSVKANEGSKESTDRHFKDFW